MGRVLSHKPRLGFSCIVKNAKDTLERVIWQARQVGVSQVVIVDTGSTDGTAKVAKRIADTFATYEDPDPIEVNGQSMLSDFSKARNFAMSLVETEFMFWLDADDEVVNVDGLRDVVNEVVLSDSTDAIEMAYEYDFSPEGICIDRHPRLRIARTDSFVWKLCLHEILCATRAIRTHAVPIEISHVRHSAKINSEHRMARNLAIVERAVERNPDQVPRFWYNYGRTMHTAGREEEAIEALERYCAKTDWNGEKYHALLTMAECYRNLNLFGQSYETLFRAVRIFPSYREAYHDLASTAILSREFDKALFWCSQAEDLEESNYEYDTNPYKELIIVPLLRATALMRMNMFSEAAEEFREVVKRVPGNSEAVSSMVICQNLAREVKIADSYKVIEASIGLERDEKKILALQKSIPDAIKDRPDISVSSGQPNSGRRRIGFFCHVGEGGTYWGHQSDVTEGCGGSETAVIRMSKEFAKLGWETIVFAMPKTSDEGLRDGVLWLPWWKYRQYADSAFDAMVGWRLPQFADVTNHPNVYVWLHDVTTPNDWTRSSIDGTKGVFVLSKAHREALNGCLPDEIVHISANGLSPEVWFKEPKNQPRRLIYPSCPTRGLIYLLEFWGEIRSFYPDAELELFYGFRPHYKEHMKSSQERADLYRRVLGLVNQPGIHLPGNDDPVDWMVSQDRLAESFHRCGIFAYPCNWPEISCINAMQAQASGAIPVTTGFWAMTETCKFGKVVGGPGDSSDDPDILSRWKEALIELMGDEEEQARIRQEMVPWARGNFLWENVAKEWQEIFTNASSSARAIQSPALI